MIVRLPIQEGMRVKKGDVVAELEDTDYRADYERAVASLEAAKQRLLELEHGNRPEEISQATAELAESEAQLVELKAERDRTKRLLPKNAISQQDYEVTESKYWAMFRHVRAAATCPEADAGRPARRAHRQRPGRGPAD